MLRPRIIPCLLVHKGGLVKTIGFEQPKYVGDPLNAVRIFNEKEVDELVVLDIDATREGREPDYKLIGSLAAECRMPLAYGGGVRTVEQFEKLISLGVEKVSIGAASVHTPDLISEAARRVGSQSVVVVIDVREVHGQRQAWTHNGTRLVAGKDPVELAQLAQSKGAGEIVLNSIDRDGRMQGYDLDLLREVRAAVSLPITCLGGAGSLTDLSNLIREFGVIGAAAGSLFVFKGKYRAVLINYPSRADKDALVSQARGTA
ncbi:MAG: AglZ/HisF2 family acetamidino modification protein [Hydrogenophaga sp.]|uniref:AglZ/HisF2 family acetamidino modification protein n=1 Tax=Hydrogenophaga sp. TaxID=1904254 RepID=UPI00260B60F5|nr:AglZ/HisF2 family acetamidino modification protein [Hydrogenophaga sp.]MDM7943744.1 AglZ/HisF2 family acetamidino modification protein [Hydrogenophaga sp.]